VNFNVNFKAFSSLIKKCIFLVNVLYVTKLLLQPHLLFDREHHCGSYENYFFILTTYHIENTACLNYDGESRLEIIKVSTSLCEVSIFQQNRKGSRNLTKDSKYKICRKSFLLESPEYM
jgi:hypothetical protein